MSNSKSDLTDQTPYVDETPRPDRQDQKAMTVNKNKGAEPSKTYHFTMLMRSTNLRRVLKQIESDVGLCVK